MDLKSQQKRILIIDRQDFWRNLSAQTLQEQGFSVQMLASYDYPWDDNSTQIEVPDLIILGCPNIGPEEETLIGKILEHKQHLLILCTSLPWQMMRSLFLAGVDDVADKPYDPNHFIHVVDDALDSISSSRGHGQAEEH